MVDQEKLLKEIKSLSDSIRQKNKSLKMGINEREQFLESTFKPVTEPLKKLAQNIEKPFFITEGDKMLPISKFEQNIGDDKSYSDLQTTTTTENSDESEEEEEDIAASEDLGEKEKLSTTNEDEENINPSNLSRLGSEIIFKGKLGRKYLLNMLHATQPNRNYHVYGARIEDNGLMIGDQNLNVDENDNIIIGPNTYKGTPGLFELIFKNNPGKFNKNDLQLFREILLITNAHKKKYSRNLAVHRNRSLKYTKIICTLFPSHRIKKSVKRKSLSNVDINVLHKKKKTSSSTTSGKGLLKNLYKTNIIYYNDPNKLVDRMRLIHEAMEAGHTGLDNEWVALVDELRTRGIITY